MKFPQLRKTISEGGIIPRGYGLAWRNYNTNLGVPIPIICYPIPLNYVFGLIRNTYLTLKYANRLHHYGFWLHKKQFSYDAGFKAGWTQAWTEAMEFIDVELTPAPPRSAETPYVQPHAIKKS